MGREHSRSVNILLPVALLLMFAVSAVALLLFGAQAYEKTVEVSASGDGAAVALSYVTEKLHAGDSAGAVTVKTREGRPVLALEQIRDGVSYTCYIYFWDGALRELFVKTESSLSLASGRPVQELSDFCVEAVKENLLSLSCSDLSGKTVTALVALRSEGGGEP